MTVVVVHGDGGRNGGGDGGDGARMVQGWCKDGARGDPWCREILPALNSAMGTNSAPSHYFSKCPIKAIRRRGQEPKSAVLSIVSIALFLASNRNESLSNHELLNSLFLET